MLNLFTHLYMTLLGQIQTKYQLRRVCKSYQIVSVDKMKFGIYIKVGA